MNKFSKLIIWIVSLIGIGQSIWLVGLVVPIDHLSPVVVQTIQTDTPWIMVSAMIVSVVVALVSLIMLLIALFAPRKADQLQFVSPQGRLSISKAAVEKILQNRVMTQNNVNNVVVKLRLRTRNRVVRVSVKAVDKLNQDLVKLGEAIQNNIAEEIQQLMNVEVKKVRVKVIPFEASTKREKASRPRVV
ncbi:alkaline shock response membrane anchor protein AmaP [Lentilactobacillus parakefiri]|uniref:Alkaline shock response membrane anchor protein AmaP n=1 Tax=Lentilactobacillus parakefiri TaxID=152332 RepID=A0A269YCX0_9LACO|nr:alkaline shock response membrane anchor protein AmaP [Lentilactobacillus parakefiri]PAK83368.1 hypothetical protein B8W98_06790 [Lentilactobacillus parakefiri]